MTQEEKAKAYDEAIKKAKEIKEKIMYSHLSTESCKAVSEYIDTIIPELGESEDERIRKDIVNLIYWLKGNPSLCSQYYRDRYDDMLAYLEKQKECGPLTEKEDEQKPADEQFPPLEGLDAIKAKYYDDGFKNGFDEGVESVKPAEWSEDYREEDIQTRFAFYTYKDDPSTLYLSNVFVEEASRNHGFGTRILRAAEKVAETIGATTISLRVKMDSPANAWYRKNGYGYVAFEDGYDWLEKNLEYLKPNKQEWSEEDEEISKRIISDLRWERRNTVFDKGIRQYDKEINWMENKLKSLRSQPRKEIYQAAKHDLAIAFMNYLDENRPESKMSLSNAECEDIDKAFKENDWAKIMKYVEKYRPSWKPSEEQMIALDGCLEHWSGNECQKEIIESLYEQLKKLM